MSNHKSTTGAKNSSDSFMYFTLWRWHFYAGIFVAPFLMILAITGLAMLLFANISGKDLDRMIVPVQASVAPLQAQANSAIQSVSLLGDVSDVQMVQYIAPRTDESVALFRIKAQQGEQIIDNMVLIDPYTAGVVDSFARQSNWYYTFDSIHSDLLLGKMGDYLLETAASLSILLIITGIYLWWHRQRTLKNMLIPNKISKRSLPRTIHATLGSWTAIVLLLFCITGVAWAGIWGEKLMQTWSQFPAGKWGVEPMPKSLVVDTQNPTHGQVLNDGKHKQVPWILEQTPMPKSDLSLQPAYTIDLSAINAKAQALGFTGRYQINAPKSKTGVWSISQDSMSYDMKNPTADRTVHIDQYSGKVLADIRFADYNLMGKFMAVGVGLHMGTLGWWSVLANAIFCLAMLAMCIAGYVLWWQRRPKGSYLLHPPAANKAAGLTWWFAPLLLLVAAAFPTALIAIMAVAVLDWLIISRLNILQKLLK